MQYPPVVAAEDIALHFCRSVRDAERREEPYRHWKLVDVFPMDLCTGILSLPVRPPELGPTDGTRGSYNAARCFMTPQMRADFPCCQALSDALQRPDVARLMAETCGIQTEGGYLRMEYIQDVDGAWLEPHRDIPEKLFSMVIYLCTGPEAAEWGTDIYDAERRWVGRSAATFEFGGDFRGRAGDVARVREAAAERGSAADGDQLCAAGLARPGATDVSGLADPVGVIPYAAACVDLGKRNARHDETAWMAGRRLP